MKPKFSKDLWLIHTQVVEIFGAETPMDRAKEMADLIFVLLETFDRMGLDAAKVCERRALQKTATLAKIFKTYDSYWRKVNE
jgi:predicted HAD superfamily Cof-like phosphohydrolase